MKVTKSSAPRMGSNLFMEHTLDRYWCISRSENDFYFDLSLFIFAALSADIIDEKSKSNPAMCQSSKIVALRN